MKDACPHCGHHPSAHVYGWCIACGDYAAAVRCPKKGVPPR